MLRKYLKPSTFPLRGGCNTDLDVTQLRLGQFSFMQNVRNEHPGLRSRTGQVKLHTTADGTNQVVNLYQYKSIRGQEQIVFAQMSDGDLLEQAVANVKIPDQYVGAFGTVSHAGGSGQIPASFSTVKDHMLYSNGADQHQLYAGSGSLVDKFVVFDGAAAPAYIPDNGRDYSDEVRNLTDATKFAILDSLNTYAAFECIFINTKVPCNSLTFDIKLPNGTGSVASVWYWNGTAWAEASAGFADGTASGGATFAVDGAMTWTSPGTAEQEKYQYGVNGFWYQIRVTVQLDAEVEIASVLFDDTAPQPLRNIWDGLEVFGVEAQVYSNADGTYQIYGAAAVDVGLLTTSDIIYLACSDKIEGIYIDPGATVNTVATTFNIKYWDGTAWQEVGTETDGTNGLKNAGWITFPRKDAMPREFNTSKYQAYWYQIEVDGVAIDDDVIIEMSYMPYFSVDEFGTVGQTNCVWKDRATYSFDQYGPYIYVSKTGKPLMLNGSDYGILKAGDGRYNKCVAQRKFVNELMVWQEEVGHEGGCVTIFEGYSPTNFGKLVLSSKIGCMNAKCVAVIDGVMTATKTDERIKTLAVFLSRYGVCVTDGRTISIVSDEINDYFDPQDANAIRKGYESQMWLNFDSADNVVRVGLVSAQPRSTSTTTATTADKLVDTEAAFTTDGTIVGDTVYNTDDDTTALITAIDSASTLSIDTDIMTSGEGYSILASKPNVFPVLDMVDKTWSFDTPAQELSCLTEVSSDSGAVENIQVVQLGGGIDDGTIYRLNKGLNDVAVAIDSYIDQEINTEGNHFILEEMALRMQARTAGDITVSFYKNGVLLGTTKTLSMIAQVANELNRRHRFYLNIQDDHITVRLQNDVVSQDFRLHDVGYGVSVWEGM